VEEPATPRFRKPDYSRQDTKEKDVNKERSSSRDRARSNSKIGKEKKSRKEKKDKKEKKQLKSPRESHRDKDAEKVAESPPTYSDVRTSTSSTPSSSIALMDGPEHYIETLKGDPLPSVLHELKTRILSESARWITTFIDLGGLDRLVDILSVKNRKSR
jgi:hypothetical protein